MEVEPVEPVQMNIYRSHTYDNEQSVQEKQQVND